MSILDRCTHANLASDAEDALAYVIQRKNLIALNEQTIRKMNEIRAKLRSGELSLERANQLHSSLMRSYRWTRKVILSAKIGLEAS